MKKLNRYQESELGSVPHVSKLVTVVSHQEVEEQRDADGVYADEVDRDVAYHEPRVCIALDTVVRLRQE
jgi:hypothetical protein